MGLERRWSAVDTCNTQKTQKAQTVLLLKVSRKDVCSVIVSTHEGLYAQCVLSDLVDAEVSHPENNRAGHELCLGALSGRRTEGSAGRGAYLTCRE